MIHESEYTIKLKLFSCAECFWFTKKISKNTPLQGFLYWLKYSGFGSLHCGDWLLHHESYREQSRQLLVLSNRSCSTLFSNKDRCAAWIWMNEQTRICIALIILTLNTFYSQTALDVLGNIKNLARTCTVQMAHMTNLLISPSFLSRFTAFTL